MGCNIHGYLEVREYPDSKTPSWKATYEIQYDRSYRFYAVLAGVRNGTVLQPISKPKGLPHDVSRGAKYESEQMGRDGHSHSYLNAQELRDYDWTRPIGDQPIIEQIPVVHRALLLLVRYCAKHYGEENVRIVFWFDN